MLVSLYVLVMLLNLSSLDMDMDPCVHYILQVASFSSFFHLFKAHLVINISIVHSKKSILCRFFGFKFHKAVWISGRTLKMRKCLIRRMK